jgi:hypothetical protein
VGNEGNSLDGLVERARLGNIRYNGKVHRVIKLGIAGPPGGHLCHSSVLILNSCVRCSEPVSYLGLRSDRTPNAVPFMEEGQRNCRTHKPRHS